jgi:hypothetical protein
VRVFSTACDSASITSAVSKWRPFSFNFTQGNSKSGWVGDDSHFIFGKKFPDKKEVWDGALPWCNSQFSCHQSSGRSLRTFSRSCRKTSQ